MKRVRDHFEGNILSKRKRVEEIYYDLSQLLGEKISDNKKIMASLNERARKVQLPEIESLTM